MDDLQLEFNLEMHNVGEFLFIEQLVTYINCARYFLEIILPVSLC